MTNPFASVSKLVRTRRTVAALPFVAAPAFVAALLVSLAVPRPARADLIAVYGQAYGGVANPHSSEVGSRNDLSLTGGARVGARILGLELFGDYQALSHSSAIERAILNFRLSLQLTDPMRIEGRAGAGIILSQGGALGDPLAGNRWGFAGRLGVDLERKLMATLLYGIGVEGEVFTLAPGSSGTALVTDSWQKGADIMATLHLKFELGF